MNRVDRPSETRWSTLVLSAALMVGCSTPPYQPKVRSFEPGEYPSTEASTKKGSLLRSGGGFIEDQRPHEVGDVLVIRVDESDSASHDTSTRLDRNSKQSVGFTGALEKIDPEFKLAELFGASAQNQFQGGGKVQRRGSVNAVLPVRVRRLLPNGDLYVEGTKSVVVGEETRHLYVSGIVRSVDILADGSVTSSRVADAEIEYTSDGDATDQQRQGWLARIITKVWPF